MKNTSFYYQNKVFNKFTLGSTGHITSLYYETKMVRDYARKDEIYAKFTSTKDNDFNMKSNIGSTHSCHQGMARPQGCGWGSRPPDIEVSCEYIE